MTLNQFFIFLFLSFCAIAMPGGQPQTFWFNRYCAHYGEVDESFLNYVALVKPQVVQVGFFGPEYYSAVGYAQEKRTDALWTSIGGGRLDREWYRQFIQRAHAQNVKVLGMFALTQVFGDAEKGRGWFAYFDKYWDTQLLGEKPVTRRQLPVTSVDLLQRTSQRLFSERGYQVEGGLEYRGCPSNPCWRETLKRFVKAGIELGLDGFTVIFPLKENCVCEHCQARLKKYLSERYTAAELKEKFGIADLAAHKFDVINAWYEPNDKHPLRHECLKFSQLMLWECLREVFIDYGRKLKPDLIVGQWNHIYRSALSGPGQLAGTFAQLNADERCTLPTALWAKGENFVWYSIGNWSMYWKPAAGEWAQFSLEHKYLREAGRGLPQAVKRDDGQNLRVYIAEAVAHGGFAYARGPNYKDPETQRVVKTYFDFLRRYENLYHPVTSYADVALVFPRSAVHRGDISAIPDFKHVGNQLTRRHVSFDVVVDELLTLERKKKYRVVIQPQSGKLTAETSEPLASLLRDESICEATAEVVTTVWQQPARRRLMVHLVNYKRDTTPAQGLQGAALERPLPQDNVAVRLKLPAGSRVKQVSLVSPEEPEPQRVKFKQTGRTLSFRVDRILVYTVAIVELRRS